ncbi:3-phosphoshikimate 1-carboxyvinyltransferase [Konateibacter massiliensis]|uniref:3-phosphoshikimate 1-carboxyvinyltransferase n=1 Tax=Konateibacter massiliensis TaxID=2002841 RepID=UPI000C15EBDD|nr:3-phosphoshikimate 1-carboxyvinyltransferase [Konateibacter massiliensis]
MNLTKASKLTGEITVPGDKSISHRTIMLGALAKGTTQVKGFLQGADCLSTIDCFGKMGIDIENKKDTVIIKGKGLHGLTKPNGILDVGNSGTTARIMSGILAAQPFKTELTGDASIQKRPMGRIMEPLSQMGASITSIHNNNCAPLHINGSPLSAIHYHSKVASAQVKSAILLAGLFAEGKTSVTEPYVSRNHTEIMLKYFGGDVITVGTTATVSPNPVLTGQQVTVPGDISSAAYFIVAGLIVPNSEILIKNVGINPTRDGILRVCQEMGGNITLLNKNDANGEQTADILVKSSELTGIEIGGSIIPTLIDEIPAISVLACFAKGKTVIKDAAELKVKESNRLDVCVNHLSAMNADITATDDGMIINGGRPLHGAVLDSKLDHRIAMSFAIAGLMADGTTTIQNSDCVTISYPSFYADLASLKK